MLVLTAHLNEYVVSQCEQLGVHGFLNKRQASRGLLDPMLNALAAGRGYFPAEYEAARRIWIADTHAVAKRLSPRETEVLRLIAIGQSDDEIAAGLHIRATTAATHRSAVLRKLDQPSTAKLMAYAQTRGFGRLSP